MKPSKLIERIRKDLSLLELMLDENYSKHPLVPKGFYVDVKSKRFGLTTDRVEEIQKAYKTLDMFLQKPKTYQFDRQRFIDSRYHVYPGVRINILLDGFND